MKREVVKQKKFRLKKSKKENNIVVNNENPSKKLSRTSDVDVKKKEEPDKKVNKKTNKKPYKKIIAISTGSLLLIFLLSNLILGLVYKDKVYPNSYIGSEKIGSFSAKQVENLVPKKITIKSILKDENKESEDDKSEKPFNQEFKRDQLGLTINQSMTSEILGRKKGYIPLVQVVTRQNYSLPVNIDDKKLNTELDKINAQLRTPPRDAEVIKQKDKFSVELEKNGKQINRKKVNDKLKVKTSTNIKPIELSFDVEKPKISTKDLEATRDQFNAKLDQKVTITNDGKVVEPKNETKLAWFVKGEKGFELSKPMITAYLSSLIDNSKLELTNGADLTNAIYTQMNEAKKPNSALAIKTKARVIPVKRSGGSSRHYSYCVQAKAVDTANLASFSAKVAQTLADSRSWSGSGKVSFSQVQSGCSFTLWLSAADQLPSFSSGCSPQWSCRSGSNVIINIDRWNGATEAWNGAGGNLNDYRSMVVNHEVGHFIGFGHAKCGGPGQPAPIMQQQSISLQGCAFNPWPTANELAGV